MLSPVFSYPQDLRKQNAKSSDLEEIPARGRHTNKGLKPLVLQRKCVSPERQFWPFSLNPHLQHSLLRVEIAY
jgi:hypothetical protein